MNAIGPSDCRTRTGSPWRDLPAEFGTWISSVKQTIRGIVCSADGVQALGVQSRHLMDWV